MLLLIFFFKQKTAYEMRISDWSSDVCSSDLKTYWQWYFLPQPAPYPEHMIGNDPDYYFEHCLGSNGGTTLDAFAPEMLAEYRRCWRDPAMITASCSDYRAGSTIDLDHDAAAITIGRASCRERGCQNV